jgi:hypothetical protein
MNKCDFLSKIVEENSLISGITYVRQIWFAMPN